MAKLKSVIGCEITANEIRAVEIAKENGNYKILAMGYIPLEEGVVGEAFIRDSDKFNDAITQLIAQGNFQTTDVAIGVNNENVLMRYATFPKVDNDKLRNMILLQAQEFIPIPIQEMEVDFVVAGETVGEDDTPQVNVMLIAARKQILFTHDTTSFRNFCRRRHRDPERCICFRLTFRQVHQRRFLHPDVLLLQLQHPPEQQ